PGLKIHTDMIEKRALADMGVELPKLEEPLKSRTKLCDLIEMYEFGVHELKMGNQFALPIIDDVHVAIQKILGVIGADEYICVNAYLEREQIFYAHNRSEQR